VAAIETAFRHQHVVAWMRNGTNQDGEPTVAPPIQLRVRLSKNQQELPDTDGRTIISQANAVVDRPLPLGSILWEGKLADWVMADPNAPRQLYEVMRASEVPSITGRRFRRIVHLGFYKSKLPKVVG
jgi:hypothetical protein